MFYSHEILTSREAGVATVWLVATLGSKSNLKKINRKAILEVDVRKTCDIIIAPEAPMALRLQSNLLYGVSRVYSQQCGYVLTDAQTAQSNMRALLKAVQTSALDLAAGKARPEQLVIQDDPAFVPDLAMPTLDLEISALDLSTDESSRRSSILSPPSQRTSISSVRESDEPTLGLIIPSSSIGGAADLGGFTLPGEDRSSAQRNAHMRSILGEDEGGFDLDPGFNFDADGNIVETDERRPEPGTPTGAVGVRLGSDSALSARVRQEIEAGMQAGPINLGEPLDLGLDLDIPRYDPDEPMLPQAEPFPQFATQAPAVPELLQSSSEARQEESSISAEAPARRRPRMPRVLGMDDQRSLRNNDLASWNNNYAINMANAAHVKLQKKLPAVAKRNAAFWVYGTGIGGIGLDSRESGIDSPLSIFAGDKLMTALTGIEPPVTARKRSHGEDEERESDREARRVRARGEESSQFGRGDNLLMAEDDIMFPIGDENIEIGRHAPPAPDDHSSQMPWNISASLRGSRAGSIARGGPASITGFPTSAGQPGSLPSGVITGSLDRRSRVTSASPLVGRGRERFSSIDLPIQEAHDELAGGDISFLGGGGGGGGSGAGDDFQLYGPAAAVTTQQAAESQWMRATLDQESNNFLEFVKTEILNRPLPAAAAEDEDELSGVPQPQRPTVQFEDLLPPEKHTKIVAAQALHHVLALATKGLLGVMQEEAYGGIELTVSAGV